MWFNTYESRAKKLNSQKSLFGSLPIVLHNDVVPEKHQGPKVGPWASRPWEMLSDQEVPLALLTK